MKFELIDKNEKPVLPFLVRGATSADYMLFDDYEEAFKAADKLALSVVSSHADQVFLYEAHKFHDGTWRAVLDMVFDADMGAYEAYESFGLHFKYYTDAGEWVNPPSDTA